MGQNLLKPLPICGQMLLRLKVSCMVSAVSLWLAAGACTIACLSDFLAICNTCSRLQEARYAKLVDVHERLTFHSALEAIHQRGIS